MTLNNYYMNIMLQEKMKKTIFILIILIIISCKLHICFATDISSPSAVVICEDTGRILYDKNANEKRPMASLTKLMTAIIFVENCRMDEIIQIDKKACYIGGSEVGLIPNTQITAKDLLTGMLLPSGNDAATQIAIHIAASTENFAKLMNIRAKELGLSNTNFVTPHGLDDKNHYSTAYEMALISKYARNYKEIKDIVQTKYATITINNNQIQLKNTNALLFDYPYTTGMKTGFTDNANRCLSASATKDNLNLIAVVLGSESSQIRFSETKQILEETFEKYSYYDLSNFTNIYINLPIIKGKQEDYVAIYNDNIFEALTKEEYSNIQVKQELLKEINAPMHKNDYIGKVTIYTGDYIIYEKEIHLEYDIQKKKVKDYMYYILSHLFDKFEKI